MQWKDASSCAVECVKTSALPADTVFSCRVLGWRPSVTRPDALFSIVSVLCEAPGPGAHPCECSVSVCSVSVCGVSVCNVLVCGCL